MGQKVVCRQEMTYNGVQRYRDEVFELQNMRNDYSLLKVGHVHPFDETAIAVVTDDSGRQFVSETSRQAYRRQAPKSDTTVIVKRPPGRPKGAKDKAPRQSVRETEPASVRI
jgi:hypothetical protein